MRAVVMRESALTVDQIDEPTTGHGKVLAKTLARGICGSDLHGIDNAFMELAKPDVRAKMLVTFA
jgi:D-arabinose 1-dehydrogenase-like Zn-dependent alcohol dehydrogenase